MPEGTETDPTDQGTLRPNVPPLREKGDEFLLFIHSFIHTRFQPSTVGLLCRHGPASAPVAEVRVTVFGNSHFTSSL